ncbi:MAG: hypothetical protein ACXVCP_08060 [Bdellovibrio sp.]
MTAGFFNKIVGSILLISATTQAQFLDGQKQDLETEFYEQLAKETTDEKDQLKTMDFIEETPNGLSTKDMSPKCDPRRFEDSVINKKISTVQYYQIAKKYFSNCSSELTSNSILGVVGLLKFAKYRYHFLSHPQVKKFMVKLSDGTRIPGILALKQDPRPRPLVIVKCGVFCSAEEGASLKSYLMHLFDQSPFNVLLLANQTGMDYIYENKKITLGGWAEGYEAIQVGKYMLEKWEHRDRISSIHLMGISLGGNAAVMGAAFNDKYLLDDGKKVFNSVTAICPVVSLKPTLNHLYESPVVGRIFAKMTQDHFKEARNYVLDVPDLLTDDKIPDRTGLMDFIGDIASASLRRRGKNSTKESYFKSNNFWNWKSEIKTPLMVWASKDDMIVNNGLNAKVVADSDLYEKSSLVNVLNLQYGNHCGFASAYGSQASAAVLRTFVLNNSPEFISGYRIQQRTPWEFGFDNLSSDTQHISQTWNFFSQSEKVKVSFKLFNKNQSYDCEKKGPWDSASGTCVTKRDYWIPISSLKKMGARVPRNDVEAQALTREFNTKVEFRTKGHPLTDTNATEFYMMWKNNFE